MQQSTVWSALVLAGFVLCAVVTGCIAIVWIVDQYWIAQPIDEDGWWYLAEDPRDARPVEQ